MNILVWIIFGALAGWIASMIMNKNKQMGAIANIVVGVIGAFIGGYIMDFFGADGITGFNLQSLIVAVVGAVVLLYVVLGWILDCASAEEPQRTIPNGLGALGAPSMVPSAFQCAPPSQRSALEGV